MLKLFKNLEIYAPSYLGKKDLLIGGGKFLKIGENLDHREAEVYDLTGLIAVPGLIDSHIHIAGAGGEGGPATRTPEINPYDLVRAGITTVVGCLGTDGITRSVESVLMKAKSLRAHGISAYIYTGAYQVPTPTITGSVARDLALIEEVIGVGEIALSDHRSSFPTTAQLAHLASEARVGAMIGGKSGILNIHMGDALNPFKPIYDVVESTQLKLTQFLPTHCNRNPYILEDAKNYAKKGFVDITTSAYPFFPDEEIKPSVAIKKLLEDGVPYQNLTMSTDAGGSLPSFDQNGNLIKLTMGSPATLWSEVVDLVFIEKIPLEIALCFVSENVANILKLVKKGKISVGNDADFLVLNKNLQIEQVWLNGISFYEKEKYTKNFDFFS